MASQETDKGYNVEGEGTEELSFSCKSCEYKHKKEGTMKSHITRQHVKKSKEKNSQGEGVPEVEVLEDEDDIEADMRLMAEWNRPPVEEAHVAGENSEAPPENVDVINAATGQEGNLEEAVERIKVLEEDIGVKEELIKKMETELETARDQASIAVAKEASLEEEKATLNIIWTTLEECQRPSWKT